ncbi:PP2C family serine/threonine-protein phosphatase [Corynebacterium sp.]|uniref:PP2C family protein-serine/threonine phosphatase n=1 Tax=Corynebacterium sp. TaxID=1720 RepID=UPI0027B977BF|nr:protein phosphatase 2C domain-containing protein [Corynebacterium sp.]
MTPSQKSLKLNYTAASDRGLVRTNNEDSAFAGRNLLVLADGMGGHAAGEVASQLLVTTLQNLDRDPGDNDMLALLGSAADDANAAIADTVRQRPETEGMGTTCTALMFNGSAFGMCHVGDSRGYRLRDGKLEQITVDDTYVQSLVDSGSLQPEDVSTHPQKSLILKAYTGRPVDPTLRTIDAKPGDRLLLCSDGLSDPVTADTIETTLREGTPEQAATRLIDLALRSGGPDNVTVVVADVLAGDDDSTTVPNAPVSAGALALPESERAHPNTAAGRAAALNRRPQIVEPNAQAAVGGAGNSAAAGAAAGAGNAAGHAGHGGHGGSGGPGGPGNSGAGAHNAGGPGNQGNHGNHNGGAGAGTAEQPSKRGRNWTLAIVVLVLLVGLIGGGWWAYSSSQDNYYIATNDQDELIIERGVDYSLFGRDLHEPYQRVCLTEDDEVRTTDFGEKPASDCHSFSLTDLPGSVRGSIDHLDSGSYSEVTDQLQRLSDKALPVCVNRAEKDDADKDSTDKDGAEKDSTETETEKGSSEQDNSAQNNSNNADDGGLSTPGVNCREVS